MESDLELFKRELNASWPELSTGLVKYADRLLRTKVFIRGQAPQGISAQDLVSNAIFKTHEQLKTGKTGKGYRKWEPVKVPLRNFLCGVIKSDISSLVRQKDNQNIPMEDYLEAEEASVMQDNQVLTSLLMALEIELKDNIQGYLILKTIEQLLAADIEISSGNIKDAAKLTDAEYKNARRIFDRATERILERGRK